MSGMISVRGPLLTDGRTHESTTTLQTAPLPPGVLRIADLGYFALTVLATIAQEGSDFLSRLHRTTALFDQNGQRLTLCSFRAAADTTTLDLPVTLGVHDQVPARLLALRVPADVSNQRRRRARAAARTHGRTPSADTLTLCDWTLLVTNAPTGSLSLAEALILRSSRGQIELLFKLWKDQGQIDESRSAQPWRVMCEVFAKLLAMVVQHWIFLVSCWSYPDRSLVKAAQSVRQHMVPFVSALTCLFFYVGRCRSSRAV